MLEHQWEIGSKHLSSLTARCGKCGLWIQQLDPPSFFRQTLAQPCLGQPGSPPERFGLHSSHCWVSIGVGWQCKGCERIIKARAKKVPPPLQQQCRTRQVNNKTTAVTRSLLQGLAVPAKINLARNKGQQALKPEVFNNHITSFFGRPPSQEAPPAKPLQVEGGPRRQQTQEQVVPMQGEGAGSGWTYPSRGPHIGGKSL